MARLRGGEPLAEVFDSVRGFFYLLGVGSLFALLDALRPEDTGFFRDVMAVFNAAAMLGAFVLGRRLAGSWAGGLVALALAAGYATFAVQTGRLYPDPLTGALFVWAAAAWAEAAVRGRGRHALAAGVLLGLALLVRSQVLAYMAAVTALALGLAAPAWVRAPARRRLVLALVLGLAPGLLAWAGIRWAVGSRDDVVRMGQVTFGPTYPFGFWQQLETDGWTGPYRFKQDPFYKALEAEARADDPDLMRSRWKQAGFTLRYIAERPVQSLLLVLDNAYRLFDRPANDYKWDYPYPYAAQVWVHRVVVVLGLAGAALFVSEHPWRAGVFLVPAALAVLHGLVFPWPRYNVPAMPILIASAGAFLARMAAGRPWRDRRAGLRIAGLVAGSLVLLGLAALVRAWTPVAARVIPPAAVLLALSVPFVLAARASPRPRLPQVVAAVVAVLFLAHTVRDRRWHETTTTLGAGVAGVEQAIFLSPEALGRLRAAPEAYIVFDLTVPRGDLQTATIDVGDRRYPGGALVPTIPRLRETTATGGRDRRGYPQWWALRLDPAALPASPAEPLRVRLTVPEEVEAELRGDRFAAQSREYEGPSFGDWPHHAALKIEYDGDYRLPVTVPLGSVGTESAVLGRAGGRAGMAGVHRIRVLVPARNEAWLEWESAPTPARGPAALVLAAYSGTRGEAELLLDGAPVLRFPLGAGRDFDARGRGWRLCHRAQPRRRDRAYGHYVLAGTPPRPGQPLRLRARYRAGLSQDPMFFVIDRRAEWTDLVPAARACEVAAPVQDGAARVLDGSHNNYPEDTGRWTVEAVY